MDLTTIFEVLKTGGPVGMAAIFAFMWWLERRERMQAQAQILTLSTASVETVVKTEAAIVSFERVIERFMDRYE